LALRYKIYTFQLRFQNHGRLNDFLGTTLHGGFGWALRKLTCITASMTDDCSLCSKKDQCPYYNLFDSSNQRDSYGAHRPHPMALRIESDLPEEAYSGRPIQFGVLLLGDHLRDVNFVISAFNELGRMGIGRQKVKFVLESVKYLPEMKEIFRDGFLSAEKLPLPDRLTPDLDTAESAFRIILLSPLRLMTKGNLMTKPDPGVFLAACNRRYQGLSRLYGEGLERELPKSWGEPELLEDNTEWVNQSRHSGRSGYQKLKFGGLKGDFVIGGLSPTAVFLINAGAILQVGKGTSLGMGLIKVEPVKIKSVVAY